MVIQCLQIKTVLSIPSHTKDNPIYGDGFIKQASIVCCYPNPYCLSLSQRTITNRVGSRIVDINREALLKNETIPTHIVIIKHMPSICELLVKLE